MSNSSSEDYTYFLIKTFINAGKGWNFDPFLHMFLAFLHQMLYALSTSVYNILDTSPVVVVGQKPLNCLETEIIFSSASIIADIVSVVESTT